MTGLVVNSIKYYDTWRNVSDQIACDIIRDNASRESVTHLYYIYTCMYMYIFFWWLKNHNHDLFNVNGRLKL